MTDSLPMQEAREAQFSIQERDDDMLIAERHWQFGWRCIARRPKLMTNAEWRPEAERIVAALSTRPAPASPPGLAYTRFVRFKLEDDERKADGKHLVIDQCSHVDHDWADGVRLGFDETGGLILAALSPDARVLPIEGEAGIRGILETELHTAIESGDADWEGQARTALTDFDRMIAALSTPATDEWQQAIEAAAGYHDAQAANAKVRYEELDRYSDDAEERQGWRSWKDANDRHRTYAVAIRALKVPLQGEGE